MNTLVISLERSVDRRERIAKHLGELHIPFKFYDAFDGKGLGLKNSNPYTRDHDAEYWKVNPPYFTSPGVDALCLTNFAIMKMALYNDWQEILVLEDDAVLVPDFHERFAQIKQELKPDCLCVYLQHCCLNWANYYSPSLKVGKCQCTAAMYWTRKGIESVAAHEVLGVPWDVHIADWMPPQPIAIPELVTQLSLTGECPSTLH